MLICKKCKASFKFKNKLFKHIFFNMCLLLVLLVNKIVFNPLNNDVVIASLVQMPIIDNFINYKYVIIKVKFLLNKEVF